MSKQKRKARPAAEADTLIRAALGITAHDVDANAAGHLTPAQQQRLWQRYRPKIMMSLLVLLLIGPAGLLLAGAAGATMVSGDRTSSVGTNFVALLLLGVFGVIAFRLFRHFENMALDVARPRLMMTQGRVHKSTRTKFYEQHETYELHINGEKFEVGQMAYQAIREGELYRLYHTQYTRAVVSAEWLENERFDIIDAD